MSILDISNIVKNLAGNQLNQIKNLIKLILRLFFHVMALLCNNGKNNMITKKIEIWLAIKEHNKQCKFWLHYETFHLNQKLMFNFTIW